MAHTQPVIVLQELCYSSALTSYISGYSPAVTGDSLAVTDITVNLVPILLCPSYTPHSRAIILPILVSLMPF